MTQSYIQKVRILYYDFFFLIVIAIIIASLEVTCSKKNKNNMQQNKQKHVWCYERNFICMSPSNWANLTHFFSLSHSGSSPDLDRSVNPSLADRLLLGRLTWPFFWMFKRYKTAANSRKGRLKLANLSHFCHHYTFHNIPFPAQILF